MTCGCGISWTQFCPGCHKWHNPRCWTKCSDSLPDQSGRYLTYMPLGPNEFSDFFTRIAWYEKYVDPIGWTLDGFISYKPTHWMPLPEEPEL